MHNIIVVHLKRNIESTLIGENLWDNEFINTLREQIIEC